MILPLKMSLLSLLFTVVLLDFCQEKNPMNLSVLIYGHGHFLDMNPERFLCLPSTEKNHIRVTLRKKIRFVSLVMSNQNAKNM